MSEKPNGRHWFAFLRPLWDSHLVGLLIASLAFVAMADCGVGATLILGSLGFRWQTYVMLYSPFVCALGCLTVFIAVPEGNHSHYRVIYGIGKVPVLGRYLIFVVIGFATALLTATWLHLLASSSIESLELSGDVSFETTTRIEQDVGEGVTFSWSGGGTYVYFLKEKQAAVERALRNENVTAKP